MWKPEFRQNYYWTSFLLTVPNFAARISRVVVDGGTWWLRWERLKAGESNGKLPPRTCTGYSVPEPYRSHDWALVPAKPGLQGWILMNEWILSSTCFGYIRPSSGALDAELQHMVFCTEFLDGWWSWEPLRRSCVRCGWCRATASSWHFTLFCKKNVRFLHFGDYSILLNKQLQTCHITICHGSCTQNLNVKGSWPNIQWPCLCHDDI